MVWISEFFCLINGDKQVCTGYASLGHYLKKENFNFVANQVRPKPDVGSFCAAHLIGLNEVEVLPMNSIAMFKVSTFLLAPGTQLLCTEDNSSCLWTDLNELFWSYITGANHVKMITINPFTLRPPQWGGAQLALRRPGLAGVGRHCNWLA